MELELIIDPEKDYSPSELADVFDVHSQTIRNWADSGRIPCEETEEGRRFRGEDVREAIQEKSFLRNRYREAQGIDQENLIENLEDTIQALQSENQRLEDENRELRDTIQELRNQHASQLDQALTVLERVSGEVGTVKEKVLDDRPWYKRLLSSG